MAGAVLARKSDSVAVAVRTSLMATVMELAEMKAGYLTMSIARLATVTL